MVPLHDDNPSNSTPWVTYGLIVINVLVFVVELQLGQKGLEQFFQTWAVVPAQLNQDFGREWVTLFSSQFLHGGFLHLGGNMLYLWIFGNNIEDRLGRVNFLVFYLVSGAMAALAQNFFSAIDSPIPLVGASGAIAGVMGAYLLRFPQARILTLLPLGFYITTVRIPAVYFLGFWFAQQALYSVVTLGGTVGETGGVAYWAHALGFVVGMGLAVVWGLLD